MFNEDDFTGNVRKIRLRLNRRAVSAIVEVLLAVLLLLFSIIYLPVLFIHDMICYFLGLPVWGTNENNVHFVLLLIALLSLIFIGMAGRVKILKLKSNYLEAKRDKLQHWQKDIKKLNAIISKNQDFILYLRDFNGGKRETFVPDNPYYDPRDYGAHVPPEGKTILGKQSTPSCFSYFRHKSPIVCLYNQAEKMGFPDDIIMIYPSNEQWFSCFEQLLPLAKYVILDFEGSITKNIETEIMALIILGKKNIIFSGTEKKMQEIVAKYPALKSHIISHFDGTKEIVLSE